MTTLNDGHTASQSATFILGSAVVLALNTSQKQLRKSFGSFVFDDFTTREWLTSYSTRCTRQLVLVVVEGTTRGSD